MALATGQITIIDLNDQVTLQGYITSSQPKTQILNMNGTTFTPTWTGGTSLVLTSEMYVMGTSSDLILNNDSKISGIRWYYKFTGDADYTQITTGGAYTLSANGAANAKLTISNDVMSAVKPGLNIKCEVDYKHSVNLPIMTYKMDIDFSLSKQAESYTTVLDNESVTITADNDGTVNPAGQLGASGSAKTSVIVYKGSVAQGPQASVPAANSAKFSLTLGTPVGCTAAIGADYKSVYIVTATADNGNVPITINLDNGTTITKNLTFSKAKTGMVGARSAVLQMYQWAASAPTTWPSGTSTYTWATGAFTAPATPNSWTLTPGTGAVGQTLYVVRQTYSDSLTTTTSNISWSASSCFPMGAYGSNGTRTAVLTMYKWSATAPTTYPGGTASTYTWATGQFTDPGTLNGWSRTVPASVAGQTLYGISQTYADTGTTTTSSVTWSSTTPFPVGQSVLAKYMDLTGEKVFAYPPSSSVPTNTSIVLTATAFNTANTTATWQYKAPGGSVLTLNAEASKVTFTTGTNPTVTITHDATVWASYKSLTIICTIDGVSDSVTLSKLSDGANPITSYCWAPSGSTFKNVIGTANPTLDVVFDIYDGSTLATGTGYKWYSQDSTVANVNTTVAAGSTTTVINVASATNILVGQELILNSNASYVTRVVSINVNAITVSPALPGAPTTGWTVVCRGYEAAVGAGWYSLNNVGASSAGLWSGANTKTLTVYSNLVTGMEVFKCNATYSGVGYTDTIVVIDQLDPVQVTVNSSNGDVFKNMMGTTDISARVYQTGSEIDLTGTTLTYTWTKRDSSGAQVSGALFTPKNVGSALPITLTQGSAGTSATISATNAGFVLGGYYLFGTETVARKVVGLAGTSVTFEFATATPLGTAIAIKPVTDNMKTITVTPVDVVDKATYICDVI